MPINAVRATIAVAAGFVAVLAVGVILDPVAAGWSDALPAWATRFFRIATRLGTSDWLLVPSGVLCVALWFGDWRRARRAVAAACLEIGVFAGVLFIAMALPGLVANIIKPLVGRVRPNQLTDAIGAFEPLTTGYAHSSFPSGHATTAGSLAIVAVAIFGRWSIPIVIAAAMIALSRVMLGVHFLSDVVAGVLIGAGGAYLVIVWMAAARLGFITGPAGTVRPNFVAVRRVLARPGGIAGMLADLRAAFRLG